MLRQLPGVRTRGHADCRPLRELSYKLNLLVTRLLFSVSLLPSFHMSSASLNFEKDKTMAQRWTVGEVCVWLVENELASYQQDFVGS
ncbi:hypothetical protein Q8A73_002892 [Channa argus]|nr:hypothetical protein Q8A73_002892 [Channa argus]